jgi:hypothetical protein
VELFVNSEKTLLSKSDIDYRFADRENILENFTLKNLETKNDILNQNVGSKSVILAPFNSTLKNSKVDNYLFELSYNNCLMKLDGKVKEANHQYELNNNCEIDNGLLIKKHSSKDLKKDLKSGKETPSNEMFSNLYSPHIHSARQSGINTPRNDSLTQRNTKISSLASTNTLIIDEETVMSVESIGYKRDYLIKCLNINDLNHAVSCFYILNLVKQNQNH